MEITLKRSLLFLIIAGVAWLINYQFRERSKSYNKRLMVLKDIGGQHIKRLEYKVREQQLPLSKQHPDNTGWFLVTSTGLVFPRPSPSQWIDNDFCILYSKSYKGNNYACLIQKNGRRWFGEKVNWAAVQAGKVDFEYMIMDDDGEQVPAELGQIALEGEQALAVKAQNASENRWVIFPRDAHELRPIVDERILPEIIAAHTVNRNLFTFEAWADRWKNTIQLGVIVMLILFTAMIQYKQNEKLTGKAIKHEVTVNIEGAPAGAVVTSADSTVTMPEPPEPPPVQRPGMVEEYLKGQQGAGS